MKENNLDVTIPVMPIPKMKIPGTAEQLQQQYNSEKWEELKESFIKLGKQLIEVFKPKEALISAWYGIKELLKVDPEIKKCYGIYKRTKNRRIRKKQMTRIIKIIERRYIKNGNMDKDER